MALGRKTGGRQKGTQNRLTVSAKAAFQLAFENSGGAEALTAWATENRTEFYRLFSKLIPTEVVGPGEHGEHKLDVTLAFK